MEFSWHLLMPLASSVLYVFGALMVKRASEHGVGVWRTAFVANLVSGVVFAPLLWLGGSGRAWQDLWQPAVVALLFMAGQILSLLAIARGDVSLATPVMGVKMVLVAGFVSALSPGSIPWNLWCAAGLSTAAVVLLNLSSRNSPRRQAGPTVTLAFLAAAAFALFDVLVQRWSPGWGAGRFLPIMLGMVVLFSIAMKPFFRAPLKDITRPGWGWLMGGALFIALQGLILILTLAIFGHATAVNVIYSTRGLWSVLAVWIVGHWFRSSEQDSGPGVLGRRLVGAALMIVAVALVFA